MRCIWVRRQVCARAVTEKWRERASLLRVECEVLESEAKPSRKRTHKRAGKTIRTNSFPGRSRGFKVERHTPAFRRLTCYVRTSSKECSNQHNIWRSSPSLICKATNSRHLLYILECTHFVERLRSASLSVCLSWDITWGRKFQVARFLTDEEKDAKYFLPQLLFEIFPDSVSLFSLKTLHTHSLTPDRVFHHLAEGGKRSEEMFGSLGSNGEELRTDGLLPTCSKLTDSGQAHNSPRF